MKRIVRTETGFYKLMSFIYNLFSQIYIIRYSFQQSDHSLSFMSVRCFFNLIYHNTTANPFELLVGNSIDKDINRLRF